MAVVNPASSRGSLEEATSAGAAGRLQPGGWMEHVRLEVVAELARRTVRVEEALQFAPGVLVPLNTPASGMVTLWAGGRAVASGRVVTVGDRFGVQLAREPGSGAGDSSGER